MGPEALAQVLRPLAGMFDPTCFPDLLRGLESPDDAAVWRLDATRALVLTADFFPPVVDDPLAPVRFVVALFDVNESTIAPGSPGALEALGSAGSAGSPTPATERPTTRDELWVPIVLIILAVLCVEWALFHRDGLVRARRAITDRVRRPSKAGV